MIPPSTTLTPSRYLRRLGVCLVLLVAAVIISPGIGTEALGITTAWKSVLHPHSDPIAYTIAFELRLPATLLALTAGATLSLCGAVFQTLFRNPLTEPYTLGIASGGSLGALVAVKLGLDF
ncbi:MAG TPA: iron chelate uptake ABC transporter family permease subunit, partial [Phycisphaerae bacterium]